MRRLTYHRPPWPGLVRALTAVLATLLAAVTAAAPAGAQPATRVAAAATSGPFDVFYVAVGSQHYAEVSPAARRRGVNGLGPLRSPRESARRVAEILHAAGASGTVLTSDETQYVTRRDVFSALARGIADAKAARARRPLVVFYFAGHGVSEGIGWNLFAIPGDFTFRDTLDVNAADPRALAARTVYAGDVVDALEAARLPFVVLFDNCQSGAARRFQVPILAPEARAGVEPVPEIIRAMNQFRDTNPVLFSAAPGDSVYEAADPRAADASLAPLARRFTLLHTAASRRGESLTLAALVRAMMSPGLDATTRPAVTHVAPGLDGILWAPRRAPGRQVERLGTATRPAAPFVSRGPQRTTPPADGAPAAGAPETRRWRVRSAALSVASPAGEFIGDGMTGTVRSTRGAAVVQYGAGDITVVLGDGDAVWEVGLATPHRRRFARGRYADAARYDFQEPGAPGLSVSRTGRGCSAVAGSFEVLDIAYEAGGRIARLYARLTQRCDGGPPLTAMLSLGDVARPEGRAHR